jgi:hypothetical protein
MPWLRIPDCWCIPLITSAPDAISGTGPAAPDGEFGLIVEDFEWDHETWSDAGRDRNTHRPDYGQ